MNKEFYSMVPDIIRLLSIQSFTHDVIGIRKCQDFLVELAQKLGFSTSFHGNQRVLIVQPKANSANPELGIVVHVDTVIYDKKEWKHNPLGEIYNGKIYGRGIVDDKGPIILAMYAMYYLKGKIKDSWQIIIGSSEEDDWIDMEEFLKENPVLPKFLITIDGDGVLNGCRGYLDLLLTFKKETFTNHITQFTIPNGMKNTVPAKAFAKIDKTLVTCIGKEVHSSIPEQGVSAITVLGSKIREEFKEAYEEYQKLFDFLSELHNSSEECLIGLNKKHCEKTSFSVTTAVMENGNTIKLNLNIRLSPGRDENDVEQIISYLSNKYLCKIEVQKFVLPSYIDASHPAFTAMCQSYQEVLQKRPTISIAQGLGYNAALPNCAIFGPRFDVKDDDEPDTCHQADESRSIENLSKFYEILKKFLTKVL